MPRRIRRSVIAIAFCALSIPAGTLSQQPINPQLEVTGTVLGRSLFSGLIIFPGDGYQPELFLFRVDTPSGDLKAGQYIYVRYRYPPSQEKELGLPQEFYTRPGQWTFTLTKVDEEEVKMRDIISAKQNNKETGKSENVSLLRRVPGADKIELPLDAIVPLYEAKVSSVRKIGK